METWLAPIAIASVATAILVFAVPAAFHWEQAPHALLGMSTGALATSDMSAKFDDGFYDKIRGWIAGAVAGGAFGASGAAANSEPELEVLVGGEAAPPLIEVAVSAAPAMVSLRATDAEGDAVRFSLWTAGADAPIALADNGDGTAALTIAASAPGEHPFEVAVSDAHGEEWAPHILRIVPAAPAPPAE